MGHVVEVIGPDRFRTVPLPDLSGIRLALLPRRRLARMIEAFAPDALHIATEGPLGLAARALGAPARAWRFTTSFHTRFPEYLQARTGLPPRFAYAWLRRFHGAGAGMMVATREPARGTRARAASPAPALVARRRPRPVPAASRARTGACRARSSSMSAGSRWRRTSRPSSTSTCPGSKVVVGDGPQLRGAAAALPRCAFRRRAARRGAGARLCRGGRVRLPLAAPTRSGW